MYWIVAIICGLFICIGATASSVNETDYEWAPPDIPRKAVLISPPESESECRLRAADTQVPYMSDIKLYIWYSDQASSSYYLILYENYPDGSTRRHPSSGFYGPFPPLGGGKVLEGTFYADVPGPHYLYYQLFDEDEELICTSNTVKLDVIKTKQSTSISISVSPSKVKLGDSVTLSGVISPPISTKITITIKSPSGGERVVEVTSTEGGYYSYTFTPDSIGKWYARAGWAGNDDYFGYTSQWISFDVEIKTHTIVIEISPPTLSFRVDGAVYTGRATFNWQEGSTHTISIDREIYVSSGERYKFERWSDGLTDTVRTIVVNKPATYTAFFQHQYYFLVESDYGITSGSGWYNEGATVRAEIDTKEVLEFPYLWTFKGWEGDAKGADIISDPILLDGPKVAKTVWVKTISPHLFALVGALIFAIAIPSAIVYQKRQRNVENKPSEDLSMPEEGLYYKPMGQTLLKEADETEVINPEDIKRSLEKLDELYRNGVIKEDIYKRLREEYEEKLKKFK
ncbi:MAG: SHOCT domain-containing protein [Archaeoglobaceae archaeon]